MLHSGTALPTCDCFHQLPCTGREHVCDEHQAQLGRDPGTHKHLRQAAEKQHARALIRCGQTLFRHRHEFIPAGASTSERARSTAARRRPGLLAVPRPEPARLCQHPLQCATKLGNSARVIGRPASR